MEKPSKFKVMVMMVEVKPLEFVQAICKNAKITHLFFCAQSDVMLTLTEPQSQRQSTICAKYALHCAQYAINHVVVNNQIVFKLGFAIQRYPRARSESFFCTQVLFESWLWATQMTHRRYRERLIEIFFSVI